MTKPPLYLKTGKFVLGKSPCHFSQLSIYLQEPTYAEMHWEFNFAHQPLLIYLLSILSLLYLMTLLNQYSFLTQEYFVLM